MQIVEAYISRFRGISSLKIQDLRAINLFVGKNNSGKTSVLEALFLLAGISNPQLTVNINRFRDYFIEIDDNNFRLLFKDLNFEQAISLQASLNEHSRSLNIRPHFKNSISDKSKTVSRSEFDDIENNLSASIQPTVNGLILDFEIKKKHEHRKSHKSSIVLVSGSGAEVSQPNNYRETISAVFLNPRTINQGLDAKVDKLLIEKQEEKLVSVLKKIDNKIEDISLGANGIIYCDIGLERLVPINVMGDGIRRLLAIVASIASVTNGLIFIDEVDNGFHYSTLKVLWDTITEASKQYNVQVFASSHSEECIRALNASFRSNNGLFSEDDIRVLRIEKEDDVHRAVLYNQETLETSLELNLGIR